MDEVGRGCLAGPVSVGVCVVDANTRSAPVGLRDSKLLTAAARERLVAPVRRWARGYGVGHAEPAEIDSFGIMGALRLAGRRALAACGVRPDLVILDGNHDWFTDPTRVGLLGQVPPEQADGAPEDPRVVTLVKGDLTCSSVAAASVLAKVERDGIMVRRSEDHPEYEWAVNKGYATPAHRAALRALGACEQHRRSWNLGVDVAAVPSANSVEAPGRGSGGRGGPAQRTAPDTVLGSA